MPFLCSHVWIEEQKSIQARRNDEHVRVDNNEKRPYGMGNDQYKDKRRAIGDGERLEVAAEVMRRWSLMDWREREINQQSGHSSRTNERRPPVHLDDKHHQYSIQQALQHASPELCFNFL